MAEMKNSEGYHQHIESTVTSEQKVKLQTLKSFFHHDNQIKEEIKAAAPPTDKDELSSGSSEHYRHRLTTTIDNLGELFTNLSSDMDNLEILGSPIINKSQEIIHHLDEIIFNPNSDYPSLVRTYQRRISSMRPEFIHNVSNSMVGYITHKPTEYKDLIKQASSYNELLHLAHSYVLSEETLFKKLPQWNKFSTPLLSQLEYGAYGQPTKIAQEIFSSLTQNAQNFLQNTSRSGIQEIPELLHLFSFDQTIHLMVRDFGHALTIEIDTSQPDKAEIHYQVPKIFDGSQVNKLPGVNKVTVSSEWSPDESTSGFFTCEYPNIGQTITDFIQKVPTDIHH